MDNTASSPKRLLRYEKLADHFRQQVKANVLKPGDQLPSFAQMQAEHGIGQGTLEKVYSILENEHLVVRLPKRGTFVAEPRKRSALNVVGVACGIPPRHHDYYSQLLQGIQEVAYNNDVEILLLHGNSTIHWEKMDGLILAGMPIHVPSQIPAISLIRHHTGLPSIGIDEYSGIKAAMQHLLELGHRKIAYLHTVSDFFGDPTAPSIIEMRMKGYQDALTEAGIRPLRQWRLPEYETWDPWTERVGREYVDVGYDRMNTWFEEGWEDLGCTAILAHNDDMALGIMRAFRERGIRVPQDMSVVGFDGTAISRQITPALTTVCVPLREAGARGLEWLLARSRDSEEENDWLEHQGSQEVLKVQLTIRESTAPPGRNTK